MLAPRRSIRRLRRVLRPYKTTLFLLVAVLVVSLAWVGARGFLAARALQGVQRDITSLQQASTNLTDSRLDTGSADVRRGAQRAHAYTNDVVWKVWSHAPLVGRPLTVTAGLAAEVDSLARTSLPALVTAAKTVRTLRRPDGTVDVRPLAVQASGLQRAADSVAGSLRRVMALPHTGVGPVEAGRAKVQTALRDLTRRAEALASGARAAPDLLGFTGKRRYLVAVQNLAEARASGGIVGAYGLLSIESGKPELTTFGSDSDLKQVTTNVVDFGLEWERRYDALGQARDWREVTATPDFPTAARTMVELWRATHNGDRLDGVVSVDPLALADILQATGPIPSPTGPLVAESFVQATLIDAYRLYPDKARRSAVLSDNARAVFSALVKGKGDPFVLGERLGHAIVGGDFKVWSAHPAAQQQLTRTDIAGALPATAPLLGVYTQDGNNDKLFTYLNRKISYDVVPGPRFLDFGDGRGPQPQEGGHIVITLSNRAPPSGLPAYVAPSTDGTSGAVIKTGQMRISVTVYIGSQGVLDSASLDGLAVPVTSQAESGLSVFSLALDLAPGTSRTVELVVRQPAPGGAPLRILQQPVVVPDDLVVGPRATAPGFLLN